MDTSCQQETAAPAQGRGNDIANLVGEVRQLRNGAANVNRRLARFNKFCRSNMREIVEFYFVRSRGRVDCVGNDKRDPVDLRLMARVAQY